jgi:capping protein beta
MAVEDPNSSHVSNIGKLVEDMELRLRNSLQEIYFGKTGDIVGEIRSVQELQEVARQSQLQKQLVSGLEEMK